MDSEKIKNIVEALTDQQNIFGDDLLEKFEFDSSGLTSQSSASSKAAGKMEESLKNGLWDEYDEQENGYRQKQDPNYDICSEILISHIFPSSCTGMSGLVPSQKPPG